MRRERGIGGVCASRLRQRDGQSTVEYALIVLAFVSMLLAMASLWHAGREGALLQRAVRSSSHQLGGDDALGSLKDVALY